MMKKVLNEQEQLDVIKKMKHKRKVLVVYLLLMCLSFAGSFITDSYFTTIESLLYFLANLPIFIAGTIYLTFIFRCPNCDAIPKSSTTYLSTDGKSEIAKESGMIRFNIEQCAQCGAFLSMKAWERHKKSEVKSI